MTVFTSSTSRLMIRFAITAAVTALFGIGLLACQPSASTMQGGEGEYCNGPDDDCRDGLICQDYVCTFDAELADEYAECNAICDRLDECDASLNNCPAKCFNTTEGWGDEAAEHFYQCFIEDLSCEELQQSDNPPQTCYDRIPLDEDREARCQQFVQHSLDCDAGQLELNELDRTCRATARTGGEDRWGQTDECADYNADSCGELFGCLNDALDLDPAL